MLRPSKGHKAEFLLYRIFAFYVCSTCKEISPVEPSLLLTSSRMLQLKVQ